MRHSGADRDGEVGSATTSWAVPFRATPRQRCPTDCRPEESHTDIWWAAAWRALRRTPGPSLARRRPCEKSLVGASGAPSDRQFVGIMVACHSAFTGGASHGGARPDQRPRGNLGNRGPAWRGRHPVSGHRPQHERRSSSAVDNPPPRLRVSTMRAQREVPVLSARETSAGSAAQSPGRRPWLPPARASGWHRK